MDTKETPLSRRLLSMREARGWSRPDAVREMSRINKERGLLPPTLTVEGLRTCERGCRPSAIIMHELSILYGVDYRDLALTGVEGKR